MPISPNLQSLAFDVIAEHLRAGEAISFRALGRSMWPSIPSRSLVSVHPCSAESIQLGDILAYERNKHLVLHRVGKLCETGVWCSGDTSLHGEEFVLFANVLGRVESVQARSLRLRVPQLQELRWLWRLSRRQTVNMAKRWLRC